MAVVSPRGRLEQALRRALQGGVIGLVMEYVDVESMCDKCGVFVFEVEEVVALDCVTCGLSVRGTLCGPCCDAEEEDRGGADIPPTRVFRWGASVRRETKIHTCSRCGLAVCGPCRGSLLSCRCFGGSKVCVFCFNPSSCKCNAEFLDSKYWTQERRDRLGWDGLNESLPLARPSAAAKGLWGGAADDGSSTQSGSVGQMCVAVRPFAVM